MAAWSCHAAPFDAFAAPSPLPHPAPAMTTPTKRRTMYASVLMDFLRLLRRAGLRLIDFHKIHPALRASARFARKNFRVHRAGINRRRRKCRIGRLDIFELHEMHPA